MLYNLFRASQRLCRASENHLPLAQRGKLVLKIMLVHVIVQPLLTTVTEEYREKNEAMESSEENNSQVHPEVEHLEELRLGEGQHDDAAQLG